MQAANKLRAGLVAVGQPTEDDGTDVTGGERREVNRLGRIVRSRRFCARPPSKSWYGKSPALHITDGTASKVIAYNHEMVEVPVEQHQSYCRFWRAASSAQSISAERAANRWIASCCSSPRPRSASLRKPSDSSCACFRKYSRLAPQVGQQEALLWSELNGIVLNGREERLVVMSAEAGEC